MLISQQGLQPHTYFPRTALSMKCFHSILFNIKVFQVEDHFLPLLSETRLSIGYKVWNLVPAELLKHCCVIPLPGHLYKLSLHIYGDSNLPKPPGFVSLCVTSSANNYWDDLHVHRPSTLNVQQWLRQSSLNPGATGRTGEDPWACRGQEDTEAAAGGRREASVRHDCNMGCFCVELARQGNSWVQDMYRGNWRSKGSI